MYGMVNSSSTCTATWKLFLMQRCHDRPWNLGQWHCDVMQHIDVTSVFSQKKNIRCLRHLGTATFFLLWGSMRAFKGGKNVLRAGHALGLSKIPDQDWNTKRQHTPSWLDFMLYHKTWLTSMVPRAYHISCHISHCPFRASHFLCRKLLLNFCPLVVAPWNVIKPLCLLFWPRSNELDSQKSFLIYYNRELPVKLERQLCPQMLESLAVIAGTYSMSQNSKRMWPMKKGFPLSCTVHTVCVFTYFRWLILGRIRFLYQLISVFCCF